MTSTFIDEINLFFDCADIVISKSDFNLKKDFINIMGKSNIISAMDIYLNTLYPLYSRLEDDRFKESSEIKLRALLENKRFNIRLFNNTVKDKYPEQFLDKEKKNNEFDFPENVNF